jgi:hypothetical protein
VLYHLGTSINDHTCTHKPTSLLTCCSTAARYGALSSTPECLSCFLRILATACEPTSELRDQVCGVWALGKGCKQVLRSMVWKEQAVNSWLHPGPRPSYTTQAVYTSFVNRTVWLAASSQMQIAACGRVLKTLPASLLNYNNSFTKPALNTHRVVQQAPVQQEHAAAMEVHQLGAHTSFRL